MITTVVLSALIHEYGFIGVMLGTKHIQIPIKKVCLVQFHFVFNDEEFAAYEPIFRKHTEEKLLAAHKNNICHIAGTLDRESELVQELIEALQEMGNPNWLLLA